MNLSIGNTPTKKKTESSKFSKSLRPVMKSPRAAKPQRAATPVRGKKAVVARVTKALPAAQQDRSRSYKQTTRNAPVRAEPKAKPARGAQKAARSRKNEEIEVEVEHPKARILKVSTIKQRVLSESAVKTPAKKRVNKPSSTGKSRGEKAKEKFEKKQEVARQAVSMTKPFPKKGTQVEKIILDIVNNIKHRSLEDKVLYYLSTSYEKVNENLVKERMDKMLEEGKFSPEKSAAASEEEHEEVQQKPQSRKSSKGKASVTEKKSTKSKQGNSMDIEEPTTKPSTSKDSKIKTKPKASLSKSKSEQKEQAEQQYLPRSARKDQMVEENSAEDDIDEEEDSDQDEDQVAYEPEAPPQKSVEKKPLTAKKSKTSQSKLTDDQEDEQRGEEEARRSANKSVSRKSSKRSENKDLHPELKDLLPEELPKAEESEDFVTQYAISKSHKESTAKKTPVSESEAARERAPQSSASKKRSMSKKGSEQQDPEPSKPEGMRSSTSKQRSASKHGSKEFTEDRQADVNESIESTSNIDPKHVIKAASRGKDSEGKVHAEETRMLDDPIEPIKQENEEKEINTQALFERDEAESGTTSTNKNTQQQLSSKKSRSKESVGSKVLSEVNEEDDEAHKTPSKKDSARRSATKESDTSSKRQNDASDLGGEPAETTSARKRSENKQQWGQSATKLSMEAADLMIGKKSSELNESTGKQVAGGLSPAGEDVVLEEEPRGGDTLVEEKSKKSVEAPDLEGIEPETVKKVKTVEESRSLAVEGAGGSAADPLVQEESSTANPMPKFFDS